MARVKISEYKAKSILLGENYKGIQVLDSTNLVSIISQLKMTETYVVKVDQGEKKRFKRGLIKVSIPVEEIVQSINELKQKGFSQFLIEEYVEHDKEMYLSFERVRNGVRIIFSENGGIDIEGMKENIREDTISQKSKIRSIFENTNVDIEFIENLFEKFQENYFSLLEINPLINVSGQNILLDCAVLVDDAAEFLVNSWDENDFIKDKSKTDEEIAVAHLDANTPASLKLQVLNQNGSIGMLLSSGGASIVIADEFQSYGLGNNLINYGEYSGGPTREETYQYAKNILSLLLKSNAVKKVLVIAGGVANFTDIFQTFKGVLDALTEVTEELQKQNIKVFVRRGGPSEKKGLDVMREFLENNNLFGSVHGSDDPITVVAVEVNRYLSI